VRSGASAQRDGVGQGLAQPRHLLLDPIGQGADGALVRSQFAPPEHGAHQSVDHQGDEHAVPERDRYALNLNAGLAGSGVFAAHVSIAANIGQGRPRSEPDVIAEEYWKLHVARDQGDFYYDDLDDTPPVLSDRYTAAVIGE
jgi:hypothetical protein